MWIQTALTRRYPARFHPALYLYVVKALLAFNAFQGFAKSSKSELAVVVLTHAIISHA